MIALILGSPGGLAQGLPSCTPPLVIYKEAVELFNQARYGAALEAFERFRNFAGQDFFTQPAATPILQDAEFHTALCAYFLQRSNARAALIDFINKNESHAKADLARLYLAKISFNKRRYEEAKPFLEKIEDNAFDNETNEEVKFMKAFTAYSTNDKLKALDYFRELTESEGNYRDRSYYYIGVIQYERNKYNEALKAFELIDKLPEFKLRTMVYITSSLLYLKAYDKLEQYADIAETSGEAYEQHLTIMRNIGTGFYESGKFDRAITLYEKYIELTRRPDRILYYRLGFANYKKNNYQNASFYFKKVAAGNDSLAQGSAYFLGFCQLEEKQQENARMSFKRCYEFKLDPNLTRDALLQYIKISFETRYFDDALKAARIFNKKYPDSEDVAEVQSLIGEMLFLSRSFRESITFLEQGGLRDERSRSAYQKACFYYGINMLNDNKIDSCLILMKRVQDVDANADLALEAIFWRGEALYRSRDYMKALESYQRYLTKQSNRKNDNYFLALLGAGWCHIQNQAYPTAVEKFRQAMDLPGAEKKGELYIEACLRTGDCNFIQKKYKEAFAAYQRVERQNGLHADYAMYRMGLCYNRLGQRNEAIDLLKKMTTQFKGSEHHDDALLEISSIYLNWISDYTNAKEYAGYLVKQHPGSPLVAAALNNMGFACQSADEKEEAIMHFKTVVLDYGNQNDQAEKALRELSSLMAGSDFTRLVEQFKDKHPNSNVKLGDLSFKTAQNLKAEGNYEQAIDQISQYISNYPNATNYYEAVGLRGECFLELQKYDRATEDFKTVINARAPAEILIKAMVNLAEVYFLKAEYDKAIEYFEKAAKLDGSPADMQEAQFGVGRVYIVQRKYKQALAVFEEIKNAKETIPYSKLRADVQSAYAYIGLDSLSKAIDLARAVEAEDKDELGAEAQYIVVLALFRQKKFVESHDAAMYLKDNYLSMNYWRAKALLVDAENWLGRGERLQATEILRSIYEKSPEEELKLAAKKRLDELEKTPEDKMPEPMLPKSNIPAQPKPEKPEPKPEPPKPEKPTPSPPAKKGATFHIIVGSYDTEAAAQKAQTPWDSKGYTTKVITNTVTIKNEQKVRYRLSIYQATTRPEVNKKKDELLRNGDIPEDAYIYTEP